MIIMTFENETANRGTICHSIIMSAFVVEYRHMASENLFLEDNT